MHTWSLHLYYYYYLSQCCLFLLCSFVTFCFTVIHDFLILESIVGEFCISCGMLWMLCSETQTNSWYVLDETGLQVTPLIFFFYLFQICASLLWMEPGAVLREGGGRGPWPPVRGLAPSWNFWWMYLLQPPTDGTHQNTECAKKSRFSLKNYNL